MSAARFPDCTALLVMRFPRKYEQSIVFVGARQYGGSMRGAKKEAAYVHM